MGTRTAQYQGGSIISFIIVTIVIAALLVGGVALLRHRGEVARQAQVADSPQEQAEETPKDEAAERADADKTQSVAASTDTSNSTAAEESETATSGASDTDTASTAGRDTAEAQGTPDVLPETGPAETAAAFIGIGAVTYAAAQYVRSRRAYQATTVRSS